MKPSRGFTGGAVAAVTVFTLLLAIVHAGVTAVASQPWITPSLGSGERVLALPTIRQARPLRGIVAILAPQNYSIFSNASYIAPALVIGSPHTILASVVSIPAVNVGGTSSVVPHVPRTPSQPSIPSTPWKTPPIQNVPTPVVPLAPVVISAPPTPASSGSTKSGGNSTGTNQETVTPPGGSEIKQGNPNKNQPSDGKNSSSGSNSGKGSHSTDNSHSGDGNHSTNPNQSSGTDRSTVQNSGGDASTQVNPHSDANQHAGGNTNHDQHADPHGQHDAQSGGNGG